MNTFNRVTGALFLAIFLAFTPNLASAQVDTPATSAQVEELKTTLINLLVQLIAQLQKQLEEVLAKQAVQGETLGAVQTQVNQVVSQTQPVAKPVVVPPPLTAEQILEQQFSAKKAECAASHPDDWTKEVVPMTLDWLKSPDRTEFEKGGYYDGDSWINNRIETNFGYQKKNLATMPISNYCSWGNMLTYPGREDGCKVVLQVLTPYAQCVLSQ